MGSLRDPGPIGPPGADGAAGAPGAPGAQGPSNDEVQLTATGVVTTWTNLPAADTEYISSMNWRQVKNTKGKTQVRILYRLQVAGTAGSRLSVKGKSTVNWADAYATFINIDNAGGLFVLDGSTGFKDSGWLTLAVSLQNLEAMMLTIGGQGGDGATDPQFSQLTVMFK